MSVDKREHEAVATERHTGQHDGSESPVSNLSTQSIRKRNQSIHGRDSNATDEKQADSRQRLLQAARILANGAIRAALKSREGATPPFTPSPTHSIQTVIAPTKAVQS